MENQPNNKGKGGAPKKTGLEYFPLHHDFFDDDKLDLAANLVDPGGMEMIRRMLVKTVVIHFFSKIFKTGYFIHWSKDAEKDMCTFIGHGMNSQLLIPYLEAMLNSGILDRGLFDKYSILTSRGIQRNWKRISIAIKRNNRTVEPLYNLITKESELLHEQSVFNSRKNKHKSRNKHKISLQVQSNQPDQSSKNDIMPVFTDVNTGNNPGNYPAKTIVSYSSSSINKSIDNIVKEEKEGHLIREETSISTGSKANNSGKLAEETKLSDDLPGEKPKLLHEETTVSTGSNIPIHKGDKNVYPLERCQWNYVYNPIYNQTKEAHLLRFGSLVWDDFFIFKWLSAFHRARISDSTYELSFPEYCKFFRNWVLTIDDYQTVDPDILYTSKDKKHGDKRAAHKPGHGSAGASQSNPRTGGVKNESIERIYKDKRQATADDLPQQGG